MKIYISGKSESDATTIETEQDKEVLALRAGIRAVIDLGASAYLIEGEVIERDEVLEILTEMAEKEETT